MSKGIILDSSVLSSIIDGKTLNSKKILKGLSDLKIKNEEAIVITNVSSFQNAIWKADPNSKIKNLKKLLDLVDILPGKIIDFRDDKVVMKELAEFAADLTERTKRIMVKRMKEK